jgi:hypothetical protein
VLEFARDVGVKVIFNLNVLHGRFADYSACIFPKKGENSSSSSSSSIGSMSNTNIINRNIGRNSDSSNNKSSADDGASSNAAPGPAAPALSGPFCAGTTTHPDPPPWDPTNARALLEFTAALPSELWPAAFGLGGEQQGYLTPGVWAADTVQMARMVHAIFTPHVTGPDQMYGARFRQGFTL